MSSKAGILFNRLFPRRQLLIRQNGEVSALNLAPWVQLTLLLLFLATLGWLFFAVQQLNTQQQTISSLESNAQVTRQALEQQLGEQRRLFAQQQAQLGELEQKHVLLQSMLESLPEPLQVQSPEQSAGGDGEMLPENDQAPFHGPLEPEPEPDSGNPSLPSALGARLNKLEQDSARALDHIGYAVTMRRKNLMTAIENAGLNEALLNSLVDHEESYSAQGGPQNAFNEALLPAPYLQTADELLALNSLEEVVSVVPSTLPAEDYYVSSSYGLRKDPLTGRRAFHKGVDLAGWHNTKIFAPADGKVKRAGRNGGYGNFIEIEHANGFTSRFGHLNKIKVAKGQLVAKNDVIGLMGSTGRSTSTHLHYEVLYNGKQINPIKITKALNRVY